MTATIWWILGFILVAAEMASGTFYLLILGATALLTGCAAYFGLSMEGQWIFAALAAVSGVIGVNRYRAAHPQKTNPTQDLDIGQPVHLIVTGGADIRVRYRGAEWQAELVSPSEVLPDTLYIHAKHGNRLLVSPEPPTTVR